MSKIIFHVDAFTSEPFRGNPAGVMISDKETDPDLMQLIAAEVNLSETAFINRLDEDYRIRFYTPESEVDLCGHATLSSSHILYETGMVDREKGIIFHSRAGKLVINKSGNKIIMNFPAYGLESTDVPGNFSAITGLEAAEIYKSDYGWILALLDSEKEVREADPDPATIRQAGFGQLIITALSEMSGYDFVVRCFVPGLGINEDPVTGSAHCALAPFWAGKTGKNEFKSMQVSKRSGTLFVRHLGDRVEIAGEAITVMKAELLV